MSRLMPIADRAKGAIPVRVKVTNVPRDEEDHWRSSNGFRLALPADGADVCR